MNENLNPVAQIDEIVNKTIEEVKELPLNINGEDLEDYLLVKSSVIRIREEIGYQRNQFLKQYANMLHPTNQILEIVLNSDECKVDEKLKEYVNGRIEFHKQKGYDEDNCLETIKKFDKYYESITDFYNRYFTEKIENGVAIVSDETLAYCKIQAIALRLEER